MTWTLGLILCWAFGKLEGSPLSRRGTLNLPVVVVGVTSAFQDKSIQVNIVSTTDIFNVLNGHSEKNETCVIPRPRANSIPSDTKGANKSYSRYLILDRNMVNYFKHCVCMCPCFVKSVAFRAFVSSCKS